MNSTVAFLVVSYLAMLGLCVWAARRSEKP